MGDFKSSEGRLGKGALWYAENRKWKILPVHGITMDHHCTCGRPHNDPKEVGKHPAIPAWNEAATSDVETIKGWYEKNPNWNVGVFAKESGFLVIDIDPRSGGDESFEVLQERSLHSLPPTVEAITGEYSVGGRVVRGRHLIYKCSPTEKFIGNFAKEGLKGIDIKHNGYILLAPSRHFSGITYDWKPGHAPWEIDIAEAPEELLATIRAKKSSTGSRGGSSYSSGDWSHYGELEFAGEKIDIDKIMEEGIDEGGRAVGIYQLACALANRFGTDPVARQMIETDMIRFNAEAVRPPMDLEGPNSLLMHVHRAIDFVANNPKTNLYWEGISEWVEAQGKDYAEKLSAQASTPAPVNASTDVSGVYPTGPSSDIGAQITSLAEQGMSVAEAISSGNLNIPKDVDASDAEDGGAPGRRSLSDVGNGKRLVDMYSSVIRYSEGMGWFFWNGQYWKQDVEGLEIQELAKRVAPAISAEVLNWPDNLPKQQELMKWANQAKSMSRIKSMIASANSDPRIKIDSQKWDSNQTLIGVLNGVIDLKTGDLLKGRPDLHITKRAPVAYTPGLRNVRWQEFINFATNGDRELQDWLQRAVGYSLTGLSDQDVLFLVYGPPGSGKNTFVETIVNALGTDQYAWNLDPAVLAEGDGKVNRTDEYHMAQLPGRRMLWVDELPESERLKENQVKKMTGSSTLSARFPGGRAFSFKMQGKLWITTNHRPMINDDAMWRRLRPIPLTNKPENPDPTLKSYLSDPEGGLPAVLAWAVEGAIKYLNSSARDPLGWCSAVREAGDIYQKSEDRIGLFLDEQTRENEGASVNIADLFGNYRMWSEGRGERGMSQIAFQKKLVDRGLPVIGQGSRAELKDRSLAMSPVAPANGLVSWNAALNIAKM